VCTIEALARARGDGSVSINVFLEETVDSSLRIHRALLRIYIVSFFGVVPWRLWPALEAMGVWV